MGKGIITEITGEGLYKVNLLYEEDNYQREKQRLEDQITELNITAAEQQITADAAEVDYRNALLGVDGAILAYNADPSDANKASIDANTNLRNTKNEEWVIAKQNLAFTVFTRESAQKRLDIINSIIPAEPVEVDAWCVDYNIEFPVGTEVGMIDIGRQKEKILPTQLIRPGGESGTEADFIPARDGQLQAYEHSTDAAVFYNSSMLPGFNKWKPTYRKGTIFSIDTATDTAVVDLDPLSSTNTVGLDGEPLNVNQTEQVTADVIYMSCASAAFEINDRVVVAFDENDWNKPQVVGFETNPVACEPHISILWNYYAGSGGANAFRQYMTKVNQRTGEVISTQQWFLYATSGSLPDYGQWYDGIHYSQRHYLSFTITPPWALKGLKDSQDFYEIGTGETAANGYGSDGACVNSQQVMVFTRWASDIPPAYGLYHNEVRHYDFDGNLTKRVELVEDLIVTSAVANETVISYIGGIYASGTERFRICDFDGVVSYDEILPFSYALAMSDSFIILWDIFNYSPNSVTINVYDLTGIKILTDEVVPREPVGDPNPPVDDFVDFTGATPTPKYARICCTDNRLTIAWFFEWLGADSNPPVAYNYGSVVISQYDFDGVSLSLYNTLDQIDIPAFSGLTQLNNIYQ